MPSDTPGEGVIKKLDNIAAFIDHTLLSADAGEKEITALCSQAQKYGFASVCVNPYYVPLCKKLLRGTKVKVCTVAGFPLGSDSVRVKVFEINNSVSAGADEIDAVINIGALKSGRFFEVENEVKALRAASRGKVLKLIIETALLTKNEKIKMCRIAKKFKADYVKTSTGFAKKGATPQDVRLLKKVLGNDVLIKASGGIKTENDLVCMLKAGASRIGTSASVAIVAQGKIKL